MLSIHLWGFTYFVKILFSNKCTLRLKYYYTWHWINCLVVCFSIVTTRYIYKADRIKIYLWIENGKLQKVSNIISV